MVYPVEITYLYMSDLLKNNQWTCKSCHVRCTATASISITWQEHSNMHFKYFILSINRIVNAYDLAVIPIVYFYTSSSGSVKQKVQPLMNFNECMAMRSRHEQIRCDRMFLVIKESIYSYTTSYKAFKCIKRCVISSFMCP